MLYELLIPDAINSVLIRISPFICHRGKSREVWRMKRENNYNIQHEWIHLCFLTKHWSSNLSWQSHLVALTHFDQCLVMLYLAVKAYQGLFYPGKACSCRQGSARGTQSESYSRKVQHPSIGQSLKISIFFALTAMTPLEKVVGREKRSHSQWASDDWQVRQPGRPFRRWVGV